MMHAAKQTDNKLRLSLMWKRPNLNMAWRWMTFSARVRSLLFTAVVFLLKRIYGLEELQSALKKWTHSSL